MIPVETTQDVEHRLRTRSLEFSLELTKLLVSNPRVTLKGDVSEVSIVQVAAVFYAYLKGEEAK